MTKNNNDIKANLNINDPFQQVYPIIYVYTVPDEIHKGLVKIGSTHGHFDKPYYEIHDNDESIKYFANKRINQQTKTGAFYRDLRFCTIAITNNGKFFSDDDVHRLLTRNRIIHKDFDEEGIDGGDE
ncbi:hypothetical protein J6W20_05530 [bacterium]|nr:hypothetical protein [bacterium]